MTPNPSIEGMPKRLRLSCPPHVKRWATMIIAPATEFLFAAIDRLHFSDSCVYPITTDSNGHVSALSLPLTVTALSSHIATLYPQREFSAEDEAHLFVTGGGAWEGEGFLALIQRHSRETLWVLYSEQAEAFVSVHSSGGIVHATSEEYPFSTKWRIRATQPPEVAGVQSRVA